MSDPKKVAISLVIACMASLQPAAVQAQSPDSPRLGLRAASNEIIIDRYPGEPVWLDLGVFVTSNDAPFELRATRPDYSQPVQLTQRLHHTEGFTDVALDPALLDGWNGLKDFFEITITKQDGTAVTSMTTGFCPNGGGRERLSDEGPRTPTYAEGCYANPFTRGTIWGIDEEWGVNPFGYSGATVDLSRGRYVITTTITGTYVDLFDIDPVAASVTQNVRVRNIDFDDCPGCVGITQGSDRTVRSSPPLLEDPDVSILPDLAALPAWGIQVENRRKRSFLTFGATVWTEGNDSMVVEGFRREEESVMDAYQYFHQDGQVIGRAPVGTMEFDTADGHNHWHFLQFAGYSLLTSDGSEIRSRKEAFCLAPTDAVDVTLPNAILNPGTIGLGSACGGRNSIWVREVLPLGWGDTYFQGLPGQSFNITKLPNGTYHIKVEANPTGSLHEVTADNNVELREVILKGKPGNRRVIVPPWNGIDTEVGRHFH